VCQLVSAPKISEFGLLKDDLMSLADVTADASAAPPMNIGIFVTFVHPNSPSQARLQRAILSGLAKVGSERYRFIVFSHDRSTTPVDGFVHHRVVRYGQWEEIARRLRAIVGKVLLWAWQLTGASGGRTWEYLARLSNFEPKHFQQMRDLNIRLLWNMNQHELKVPVPFMRTIWEANHRIRPMYPEYSYTVHGFDGLDGRMADSLARASYVITGTVEGKRQLVEMLGVYEAKVRVIPFPAPILPDSKLELALTPSERYILYPARFWPHKNHVVILEALEILKQDHSIDLTCVFTGADQGNLAYVLNYAERLGIRDLIDYRGEITDAELAALYKGAVALVFASAAGPDNLPPLEAMALSCPVIIADVPGAREQCGDAALYFGSTDERSLADRLLTLLADNTIRQQRTARGKERITKLDGDNYATAVMSILDEFSAIARAWERCDSRFT
jgi:glycosyltransferase involved in cell wall biosynthesis